MKVQHNGGNVILQVLGRYPVTIGLCIRLFLAWFLPWLLDDGRLIPGVSYTDIDFYVFTDAATYIQRGQSPFARHTYRYTPFLAEFLANLPYKEYTSRYLFCVADTICGWIIIEYRKSYRNHHHNNTPKSTSSSYSWIELQDAFWWLYNPLAINICTRGSAESFMVLLPVLVTVRMVVTSETEPARATTCFGRLKQSVVAGLFHGIAVHSKLYPIIYSLSFMAFFATQDNHSRCITNNATTSFPWMEPRRLIQLIQRWITRLLAPAPILFLVSFVTTFAGLTYLAVYWYGPIALQEGLLYHFSRVDHRHNYSMFWYWIYLARANVVQMGDDISTSSLSWLGRLLLLPQAMLLVYSSLGIAPYNLALALFVQTYLFVTHNKVITAQYFTWYLCLLPLCSDSFQLTKRVKIGLVALGMSILLWLSSAYCLEMQGMAVHKIVWIMSTIHFGANVNLLGALLASSSLSSHTSTPTKESKVD